MGAVTFLFLFRPTVIRATPPVSAGRRARSSLRQLMLRLSFKGIVPLCLLALTACSASRPVDELRPRGEQALRPGDIVQLVVWREEDLSGDFMVDQFGHVILPRVGKWDVREETESSLEERLTEALGHEIRDAAVDVIILRRIRVLGAVVEPGLYSLDNTMTLGDALATAGGVDPTGRRDRVEIVRGSERYVVEMDNDRALADLTLHSGDALFVPQRNWFLRNYVAVLTGLSSLAGLMAVVLTAI